MLSVIPVPAFKDNYLWLIHDGNNAAAVDPGDAAPILAALASHNLSLNAILLTHHHADHIGGVPELLRHFKVPVFGPIRDNIDCLTDALTEGDRVHVPALNLDLSVIDVPGHTGGHIAYYAEAQKWLFCGDTLFAGGCGRLFEGTPQQMVVSLAKLAALPETTKMYCAHEYTLANLHFAHEAEPSNHALQERIKFEQAKRDQGLPTLPSTIGLEKATNPFLRYREPEIVERLRTDGRLQGDTPVAAFAALREWKNHYRG